MLASELDTVKKIGLVEMLLMTMCAVNTLHNYPVQFHPELSFIVLSTGL